MLQRLLMLVSEGSVLSRAELARQLGVSEGLLKHMLQDLAQMGFLRAVGHGCEAHCAGCSSARTCTSGGTTHVWALTDKGRQPCATTSGP